MRKRPTLYRECPPFTKRIIRQAYIGWKHDKTSATFEDWAEKHAFYLCRDGSLDLRYNYCEPAYMAREDEPCISIKHASHL